MQRQVFIDRNLNAAKLHDLQVFAVFEEQVKQV
jgi:hypothetical protein